MLIESAFCYDERKVSFKSEKILYFCEYKDFSRDKSGTSVILNSHGGTSQLNINTPYEEFKKLMNNIEAKKAINSLIQSPYETTIVPLNQKKEPRPFKREELASGNYVRYYEKLGHSTEGYPWKESKGWIKHFTQLANKNIFVDIRCDDEWNNRAVMVNIDDIIEILPDKEQPL